MGSNVSLVPKCEGQYMVVCINCLGPNKNVIDEIYPADRKIHFRSLKDVLNDIYVFVVESFRGQFKPPTPCLYFEQYTFRSLKKVTASELIQSIDTPLDIVSNGAHLHGCCYFCSRKVKYTVRIFRGDLFDITWDP